MVSAVDAFYDSSSRTRLSFTCAVLNSWENTIKQVVEFGSSRFLCDSAHILAWCGS